MTTREASLAGKNVSRYHHICAFFDSRNEEYEVLGPFFKEGLEWGEKSVHIVDPKLAADHIERLKGCGIDTDHCQSCGQLDVLTWNDAYLSDGTFDQARMLGAIEGVLEAGREAGYPKMRIMGNMNWTLNGNPGTEQVIEFESRVNEILARSGQLAVCVYDAAKLSGAMMMDILRSHPFTLVGNVIYENPFYTPPEELLRDLRARNKDQSRISAPVK
jgi:hypothetical protein